MHWLLASGLGWAGSQVSFVEGKCKHTPVPRYISYTRLYDFAGALPTAAEIEQAKEEALAGLVRPKCEGMDPSACKALQRAAQVVDYTIEKDQKKICALAMVSAKVALDPLNTEKLQGSHTQKMEEVAQQVAERIGASTFWVQPPYIKKSGCSAGAHGLQFQSEFKRNLLGHGASISESASSELGRLSIAMVPGEQWTIELSYKEPGSDVLMLIASLTVPEALVGRQLTSCAEAKLIGLDGLSPVSGIELTIDMGKSVFCEGEAIHPVVRSNMPAQVRVFSVMEDGTTYLSWPSQGGSGQIGKELDLGEFKAIPIPSGGEERLLVIALPEGGEFGDLDQYRSFCKLPRPLKEVVPLHASISSVSYSVMPAGIGACPSTNFNPQEMYQLENTLRRVRSCR
jgi:hypothetical protein